MKVLFIAKSKNDPATRYRVLPLQTRLAELNVETTICDDTNGVRAKFRLLSEASRADLVFIQRKLFAPWLVSALKRRCPRLVYDFDDAVFSKSSGELSSRRMAKFRKIIRSADLVLAGNEYLGQQCKLVDEHVDTIVIPTPVDQTLYDLEIPKEQGCVLVWVGSRSTRKYLESHRNTFEEIGCRFPDVMLKIVADFDFTLDNLRVENIPWTIETESKILGSAHIGIAPMVDNRYTKGKCALKIIQYMAAGLPVISSRVGANSEVVVHGETGLLVDTLDDWIMAIELLSSNPEECARMGLAGYERMLANYCQRTVVKSVIENFVARNLIPEMPLSGA